MHAGKHSEGIIDLLVRAAWEIPHQAHQTQAPDRPRRTPVWEIRL